MNHERGLFGLVDAIDQGNIRGAESELAGLLEGLSRDDDPRTVAYHVFGAALARRLSRDAAEEANLYLDRFDVPQIHLFNLLAREVPQVSLTTVIANQCIARAIERSAHPTVIDIGIGTARQMLSLFELLAALGKLPERMTLIGVEPSASSLELAQQNVASVAQSLGVHVGFHAFTNVVEKISRSDWARIAELCQDVPVINASFALHHIGDVEGLDVRNDVLLRLRSLNPLALVLSEPNVDHMERSFSKRFANCYQHFGETFRVLDELPIVQAERDALKVCFFGREIADILGNPEDRRSERHESTASWLRRLGETGFVSRVEVPLPPSGPLISVSARDGYVTLDHGAIPLVSVLSAVPIDAPVDVDGALARAPVSSVQT